MKNRGIPEQAVTRISIYLRCLKQLSEEGRETISSQELADLFELNAAQIRKDLAYFGEFGVRGVGYAVEELKEHLMSILGLSQEWPVAVAGYGKLGAALCRYQGLAESRFRVAAIFDVDPLKVGQRINGATILHLQEAPEVIAARGIRLGVITVPGSEAQRVADLIVQGGVAAILNFAPIRLILPGSVKVRNVDLTIALENLSFYLSS